MNEIHREKRLNFQLIKPKKIIGFKISLVIFTVFFYNRANKVYGNTERCPIIIIKHYYTF